MNRRGNGICAVEGIPVAQQICRARRPHQLDCRSLASAVACLGVAGDMSPEDQQMMPPGKGMTMVGAVCLTGSFL